MSRITLAQITEEISQDGWKVISSEYHNLDTVMEFQCNEGHKVFTSWGKLRAKRECPVCKKNIHKENKQIIVEKKRGENRILALDQASYITGYSIFDGKELVKYGIFETLDSENEFKRINDVKVWLISMIENWKPDFIAIEGIQYQANFGVTTFQTLARLQGVLAELCYELNIPFEICPTNTWRSYCKVKGQSRSDKKKSMQLIVKNEFDISVSDDCADAIGIGKYAAEIHRKKHEVISWI